MRSKDLATAPRPRYADRVIRNVVFDWSGTLVDDLPAVWQATNHVLRQAGVPELTLDAFRAEFCLPFARFYERYTAHIPLPQLETWFHGYFQQVRDSVEPLPHAREFLDFCKARGLRTLLVSTVHKDHFDIQARRTGFGAFLDRPYVEVWDKRERIRGIMAENHLDPRETLFVGDMQHDIEAAKHGGMFSCAVLTGYNRFEQLDLCQPDLIVAHLGELRAILEEHQMDLASPSAHRATLPRKQPIVTVGALILNSHNELLLVRTRKWSDLWGIPGGKVRYGEPAAAALRREIKEETNLEIADINFAMVQDCIHSTEFHRDAHFVLLNYVCRCRGQDGVTLNDEAQEFRWLNLGAAEALPLNQPTRKLIEHYAAAKRQHPH
jgi:phosphoglycolate phosphatase-like HAD superfamily hydrolase/ADP-ribose pyrophosphatase YjhB (NUDIX family)